MATEYGVRYSTGIDHWSFADRATAEKWVRDCGAVLIAREVSEPRIVSIRA